MTKPETDLQGNSRGAHLEGDYVVFELPKRNGGMRRIEAPKPHLKLIQRKILSLVKVKQLSPFAFGCTRGAKKAVAGHHQAGGCCG